MGFFDFLKNIIRNSAVTESENKEEKLSFKDIGSWVERKEKEIKDKEKDVVILIKDRTSLLVKDLNIKVKVLENIDVESKKVEDRIKLIVRGNLNNYISYVRNLIKNIDGLHEEKPEKLIYRVKDIFFDFEKKSYVSYQKATFLIGKEMGDIKESIVGFSKYLTRISDKNKDIIDSPKVSSFIKLKLKLNQIDDADKVISGINEGIKLLDEKIKNVKNIERKNLLEIERIKKTKNHTENLKKQEEIKLDEKELEKEIYKLKEMVDFKVLGNLFHACEKERSVIKAHKENFQSAFQEDGGASILSLIKGTKLDNEAITSKIKQINTKKQEIEKNKLSVKKDETEDLLSEIKGMNLKIKSFNNEKEFELKKLEKVKINKENLITSIKEDLGDFGVFVE